MRALKITTTITPRDQKSLDQYLNDISKYGVLTPEEEVRLFESYQSGDEDAFVNIVFHNLRFVVSVAKKYQHLGLSLGDLINEGNVGLIKAAHRFDVSKGFKFISYAVWWIRQSILQAINDKGRKIRIPLNLNAVQTKVQKKIDELVQQKERHPSVEELADALDLKAEVVQRSLDHYRKCRSLDAPVTEDGDVSMVELLQDDSMAAPDHNLSEEESRKLQVKELLDSLPERQAVVISLYFGLGGSEAMTLESIGDHLGMTRERVRQIRDKGLRKMRGRAKRVEGLFSSN